MGQKGSNKYTKKQLDTILEINEDDSQESVKNLNQNLTYQETSIQNKNKQKENNVELMEYGEENAGIFKLNNNSSENSGVFRIKKMLQLKEKIDSKKATKNRAIKKLYEIYKKFKSDLYKMRIEAFNNIKNYKDKKIYDICVALKNACAEENEARGNCGITAAAMAHYGALNKQEMKAFFYTCKLERYCTSIDYDLSFKSQNGAEKLCDNGAEKLCDNGAEKLCDMDNYCFGMFLYYYANKFDDTDPNKAKFFSDKYNSDIEKVLKEENLSKHDIGEMGNNFINHSYNRGNANNIKNESQSEQMNFSKFMRNLILDGIIGLAKSYDGLAKNKRVGANGKIFEYEANALGSFYHFQYFTENNLESSYSEERKQELLTDGEDIDKDVLGLGLSHIAQKPIFIFDVSGKGNAKLWVYDAQKIGNSQYRYRTIFCFDSQNSNMEREEILLAQYYSKEVAKDKSRVLFFESMNGKGHFSYLDPNNKKKRELFSDNISELLLNPYIIKEQEKTKEMKLKKENQSNPKIQNEKLKSVQSNANINKTLEDELHEFKKMQKKLEKRIPELEEQSAKIEEKKDCVQTELNKVDSLIKENESKIQEQQRTIRENESRLLNLKQNNENDEKLIETQGNDNADLETIIQKQKNQIKENEKMILKCKKECKENNIKINRSNQNQKELKSKKGKQEENHKTEGYNKAIRFLSLPTCTDNAASKFSLFYFLAWVFSWLFDFCKDYVSQTCTIINLNRKFAQLRSCLVTKIDDTGTIIKNSSETANDIFKLLDVFLPKLEGEFFIRYASIYITMLNLYKHDTRKIYEALSQNNISNRDNEVLRMLKERTKPVENQKNEFINEELNNDNNELQKNINLNNNIIDLK